MITKRKLNLTNLSEKEMKETRGGVAPRVCDGYDFGCCSCGCAYEGEPGGSTTGANFWANYDQCLTSPQYL